MSLTVATFQPSLSAPDTSASAMATRLFGLARTIAARDRVQALETSNNLEGFASGMCIILLHETEGAKNTPRLDSSSEDLGASRAMGIDEIRTGSRASPALPITRCDASRRGTMACAAPTRRKYPTAASISNAIETTVAATGREKVAGVRGASILAAHFIWNSI